MTAAKAARRTSSPPAGLRVEEKTSAPPLGDETPKPAKPPRKRRPRFVL
jgi:hypothetical protein